MKVYAVYAESINEDIGVRFQVGCYSSLKKAEEAVDVAERKKSNLYSFVIQPWETDLPVVDV